MALEYILIFFALTVVAEILGTVGGFGSSVFFVPLAGLFFDFHSVLGITAAFHVLSNLTKIAFFRDSIDRRLLLWMGLPSALLVIAGALLSGVLAPQRLQIILSVFVIALSLFLMLRPAFRFNATNSNALMGGGISGFAAGLLGTGGALRGLLMAAFNLPKGTFIATSACIDLGTDVSRLAVYAGNGFVHLNEMIYLPVLFVASVLGTLAGKFLLARIPQEKFRQIVLSLIFVIGIFSLAEARNLLEVFR